jgi:hypothetical protein
MVKRTLRPSGRPVPSTEITPSVLPDLSGFLVQVGEASILLSGTSFSSPDGCATSNCALAWLPEVCTTFDATRSHARPPTSCCSRMMRTVVGSGSLHCTVTSADSPWVCFESLAASHLGAERTSFAGIGSSGLVAVATPPEMVPSPVATCFHSPVALLSRMNLTLLPSSGLVASTAITALSLSPLGWRFQRGRVSLPFATASGGLYGSGCFAGGSLGGSLGPVHTASNLTK